MGAYDSDSSGDDDNEYTQTNVVLGFAAQDPADESDTISHLGGSPEWLDPATPPSAALAKCKICNDIMVLLLQLNGDLPDVFAGHERRLYVLSCRRKTCRRKEGSVRALRGVRVSEAKEKAKQYKQEEPAVKQPSVNIGGALFGSSSGPSFRANPFSTGVNTSNANPFSAHSSTTTPSNPFAANSFPISELASKPPQTPSLPSETLPKTFASVLSINNDPPQTYGPLPPPVPWPQESDLPKPYPLYYLEDDIEYLDKLPEPEIPAHTMDLDEGSSGSGGGKEDKEIYESTIDKTFQKFADRLSQNPEQVIRYEFKGQPLLYSKMDAVGKSLGGHSSGEGRVKVADGNGGKIPRCGNCGSGRVFEVQLTPHAIMELEKEEAGLDGMEWGTIIVGVCEKDCQLPGVGKGVGYVEEWAGVQWEEVKGR